MDAPRDAARSNATMFGFGRSGVRSVNEVFVASWRAAESNCQERSNVQRGDYWQWLVGPDGRDLCSARELGATCDRWPRAGRAAFVDDARREFSGISRWNHGAGTHREHAQAGDEVWDGIQVGDDHRSRFEPAAVQDYGGKRRLRSEDDNRGGGSFGAIDWVAE